jgi:immunity protein 42 of polymorphic toxin system
MVGVMLVTALFGAKSFFAIECRIDFESDTKARNAVGEISFWVDGHQVGNPDVVSTIGIAAADLERTLQWCRKRYNADLYVAEKDDVLNTVFHYAFEDESGTDAWVDRGERFLVCMTSTGNEWVDGWLFAMVEGERGSDEALGMMALDRFLYREPNRTVHEVWLPANTYGQTVREFLGWFAANSTYRTLIEESP